RGVGQVGAVGQNLDARHGLAADDRARGAAAEAVEMHPRKARERLAEVALAAVRELVAREDLDRQRLARLLALERGASDDDVAPTGPLARLLLVRGVLRQGGGGRDERDRSGGQPELLPPGEY